MGLATTGTLAHIVSTVGFLMVITAKVLAWLPALLGPVGLLVAVVFRSLLISAPLVCLLDVAVQSLRLGRPATMAEACTMSPIRITVSFFMMVGLGGLAFALPLVSGLGMFAGGMELMLAGFSPKTVLYSMMLVVPLLVAVAQVAWALTVGILASPDGVIDGFLCTVRSPFRSPARTMAVHAAGMAAGLCLTTLAYTLRNVTWGISIGHGLTLPIDIALPVALALPIGVWWTLALVRLTRQ
jgi:hypothetical protein